MNTLIQQVKYTFRARLTKQGKLVKDRNSIKSQMGIETDAGDQLTMGKKYRRIFKMIYTIYKGSVQTINKVWYLHSLQTFEHLIPIAPATTSRRQHHYVTAT